jgi:methanethiol oxidase
VPEVTDPTFCRSPAAAMAAPPEGLAYVAGFDPAGTQRDAMTVVDRDARSPTYGAVVGWTELPTAGNELHHFGWNAVLARSATRAIPTTARSSAVT